jgi:hypothetical protein
MPRMIAAGTTITPTRAKLEKKNRLSTPRSLTTPGRSARDT